MTVAKANPDLTRERNNSSFKSKELGSILYGATAAKRLRTLVSLIRNNKAFDTSDLYHLNRTQRYTRACERALEFVRIVRDTNMMEDEELMAAFEMMVGEDFFVMLHLTMFIPTIENLADEDQLKYWLPLARDFRIMGTYAQTELAHGSNVAALRTTADLDLETDEWVLNTPNLEATKWWPGGLAKSCNACILMARLRIRDKDYGVHAFMLRVRDPDTHQALPGVLLIDIGQKMGYNGMDNGGMQLHQVRIPRNNLLQRYVKVDRQGNYSKVGNERMLYATMTFTRKQIIMAAGPSLAKAATIATRYSIVRRQFPQMDQSLPRDTVAIGHLPEAQVLDYSTQQYAILPTIATAVAFMFAGRYTNDLYCKMITAARKGDFSSLSELHILTSSLKGSMTMLVIEGMEACRRAMGGHGYLLSAGVPIQYVSYVPQATYEGDFVVLSIQTGRSLLRMVKQKMEESEETILNESPQAYIKHFDPFRNYQAPPSDEEILFDNEAVVLEYFERRSCALIYQSAQRMVEHIGNGLPPLAALDEEKIAFTRISKAHCHAVALKAFKMYLKEAESNRSVHDVLKRLYFLYAAYWMEQEYADFISAKVVTIEHQQSVARAVKKLMSELRPDAIAIVDGFGFPDFMLNSTLGRYDGNVYEALYQATVQEPLNQTDVTEGYYRYIQYILHPERTEKQEISRL